MAWAEHVITRDMIEGKAVLECGSRDVNGSLRPMIEAQGPVSYIGVDMEDGPGVDVVMDAADLSLDGVLEVIGPWDVVVCTEMLEHAENWQRCLEAMLGVLAPG